MNREYIYKRRLLKLADFLDQLPEERFYYARWVGSDWEGKANLSCGTTACALGWATTIPAFRRLGLRLIKDPWSGTIVTMKYYDYINNASADAANVIFGLSRVEFEYLFIPSNESCTILPEYGLNQPSPNANATPKDVAEHIRKFVGAKYSK